MSHSIVTIRKAATQTIVVKRGDSVKIRKTVF